MTALIRTKRIEKKIYVTAWAFCFTLPLPIWNGQTAFFSMLLFLLWILEGNFKEKLRQLGHNKLLVLFFVFLGYNVLSLLWTEYFRIGIETLKPYKYYLLIIPPLLTSIPPKRVPDLIFAFVLGVLLYDALAYATIIFNIPASYAANIYTPYAIYGPFTAFSALYFINKLFQKKTTIRKESIFYFILAISLVILLFFNRGRSGQVGFLVAFVAMLLLYNRKPLKTVAVSVVAGLAIMLLIWNVKTTKTLYVEVKDEVKAVLQVENYASGNIGVRIGFIVANLEVAKQHLFFGTGIGDSRDALQRLYERGENPNLYPLAFHDGPHNQYLTFLTKLGLVGLFLFIAYIFMFFKIDIPDKETKILSMIFMILFAFNCLADEILFMKPYNIYFAVMSALFMRAASKRNASE